MNNLSPSTQAILLLTSPFSKHENKDEMPLTPSEWGVFASWLYVQKMKPEDLLKNDFEKSLQDWSNKDISIKRLKSLLNRGAALALAIEKWNRVGLWVLTRSYKDYPQQIKSRLKQLSPPVLYGIGNKKLLNTQAIAVVGSREAKKEDLNYAYDLGKKIAKDGFSLVSGGAKGIDESVMQGTLENFGKGIVILSENLLKNSLSEKYRHALLQNNLVLISPYYPESPFSVVNAMARNKYIYTLSIASIVVHSNASGGTWNGANEALKKRWTPLWIKESIDPKSPNQLLINAGANVLTQDLLNNNIRELQFNAADNKLQTQFDFDKKIAKEEQEVVSKAKPESIVSTNFNSELSVYDFFICKLKHTFKHGDVFKPKEIEELFELKSAQINDWIIKAETDNILIKLDGRIKKYKFV